ncbi:MAG: hypothetical protein ABSF15_20315 [Candidatus Sulfotelmatobacter sp.]|jgi:hypothetical protein
MVKLRQGWAILVLIAILTGISSCGRQPPKLTTEDRRSRLNASPPAATASDKPQPSAGDKPSAGIPQAPPAQPTPSATSSPLAHTPATAKPAPAEGLKNAPKPEAPEPASLSGNWHGMFTHQAANQIANVTLHIEDHDDLLTGTLTFDPGGENSAACSLRGSYNLLRKFMVLLIGTCRGRPPNYLQGRIGFTSVNLSDRRIVGVEPRQNGVLDISR